VTARRSSSDPVSRYLATGERVVWRHQPAARTLVRNRLPVVIVVWAMTAFVMVIGWNVVSSAMPETFPVALEPWLVLPAGALLFFLVLTFFFLRTAWEHTSHLLDSWSTHYALTDRRFLVVSRRGLIEYDASYFRIIDARGGGPDAHVLLFDYGPSGKHKRDNFRDRVAGLPDAQKLKQLIQDTLRP
jgi:hypothetical protein